MADENTPQVAPPAAPAPGTPEYDEAMAAKVDEAAAAAKQAGDGGDLNQPIARPENIPEEFWDASSGQVKTDALLDFYNKNKTAKDAEAAQKKEPETPPKKEPEEAQKDASANEPDAAQQDAPQGVDLDSLAAEFAEKGQLSAESYAKLAQAGIDKGTVDIYIAGQQAIAREQVAAAYEVAGGAESYSHMVEWAKTGLSHAEKEAFNTSVGGSREEMLQAIHGLKARYEAEFGRPPRLLGGNGSGNTTGGYESRQQMVDDMRDPRYARDSAFRAKVTQRIALSNF